MSSVTKKNEENRSSVGIGITEGAVIPQIYR
jgi:hypothetical protein